MTKLRITQHKVKRDEARAQESTNLKRENTKLKRTVKRLEKEVTKRLHIASAVEEDALDETGGVLCRETLNLGICPTCRSDCVRQIILLGRSYRVCKDCGWRKRD